jgi:hypothetical protein
VTFLSTIVLLFVFSLFGEEVSTGTAITHTETGT